MKYILQIIVAIAFILSGKYYTSSELKPEFVGAGLTILITLVVVELGYDIYINWDRLFLVIRCKILALRGQYVRFSMSYQYRIKVKDKYLLVKNSNFNHYQLVGGKYKRNQYTYHILKKFDSKDG